MCTMQKSCCRPRLGKWGRHAMPWPHDGMASWLTLWWFDIASLEKSTIVKIEKDRQMIHKTSIKPCSIVKLPEASWNMLKPPFCKRCAATKFATNPKNLQNQQRNDCESYQQRNDWESCLPKRNWKTWHLWKLATRYLRRLSQFLSNGFFQWKKCGSPEKAPVFQRNPKQTHPSVVFRAETVIVISPHLS